MNVNDHSRELFATRFLATDSIAKLIQSSRRVASLSLHLLQPLRQDRLFLQSRKRAGQLHLSEHALVIHSSHAACPDTYLCSGCEHISSVRSGAPSVQVLRAGGRRVTTGHAPMDMGSANEPNRSQAIG
jgi:hypothetical protein